jgi:hypothetical protein
MMKQEGLSPSSGADFNGVYGACDAFGLFDALLRATGGNASAAAVSHALPAVGGAYVSASTVGGRVAVREGRVGAGAARLFGWVNGHFEYTSGPFAL